MKGYKQRKAISGQRATRVTISVDAVTDVAVRTLMARESLSYSAGICALATAAAITDGELMAAIKIVVANKVHDTMADAGFHPGLSREIARELVTGHSKPHVDYPTPGLDGEGIQNYDGHI